jgi:hypothetical protein
MDSFSRKNSANRRKWESHIFEQKVKKRIQLGVGKGINLKHIIPRRQMVSGV